MHLCAVSASAQTTKIKGRVTDAETGEGLPFAAVLFEGTTIGVSTDMDGYYTMETRDTTTSMLKASLLGYIDQTVRIRHHSFNEVNFRLQLNSSALNAAVVKPDNRYMKWILSQIDENREKNDPERRDAYKCDTYTKMELDLTNAEENLRGKMIRKNFGFVFDYMDTSVVSGQPYLPVMISETRSKRYHDVSPEVNKETIEATRVSGLNENNIVQQFTGSMYLKTNFYNNFIDAFDVQIPTPLSSNGNVYYNYYLVDSLHIDGRKTWKIRFHPKKGVSSSVFDGEMSIDSEEFALREIHVKLIRGANVNWIRDMVIDRTDQRLGDSAWFYKNDKIYIDFSVTMRDSSKMISFLGTRQIEYMDPAFGDSARAEIDKMNARVQVAQGAGAKDDEWWNDARPYELSDKEQKIYEMVDSVKSVPLYNSIYNVINTVVSGYLETKYVAIGPYSRLYSFNKIEGSRVQIGGRTTAAVSKKFRVGGYVAYGFKDKDFKGGGTFEWLFSKEPQRKLTLTAKKDMVQLGRSDKAYNETSLFTSILTKQGSIKRSIVNEYSARYDWEIRPWLNTATILEFKRIHSNAYVPMKRISGADTVGVASIGVNSFKYSLRFSKDETVSRTNFDKYYLYSAYPIVTLDLMGSLKGIGRNEYSYFRTELSMDYTLRLPPVGQSKIQLSVGKIVGTVPYPMLKLHEGNGTYILDKSAFACMDFYEFASDTWCTAFLEHNFGGFFLGKIPLIKKLHWREVFTVKAAYGTLSKKNNGILGSAHSSSAPMLFPEGMSDLNKPYVEMGVGISNILRMLRVDTFWRMTHRYTTAADGTREKVPHCFAVNVGLEIKF